MDRITKLERRCEKIIRQMPSLKKILRATISKYYLTYGYKKCRWHREEDKKHGPYIGISYLNIEKIFRDIFSLDVTPTSFINFDKKIAC